MAKEKVTKTSIVIRIMTENKDKPMAEVVKLIEKGLPCRDGYGKTWYRWAIKEGVAPGKLDAPVKPKGKTAKAEKPAKAPKLAKEAKAVEVKPKGNRFTGKIKADAKPKTEDEVAKIKAANLKRMQEITARNKVIRSQYNGNIARGADDPIDPLDFTPEGARMEVDTMINEIDSFQSPRFLSKDEVKSLV
jgi:hypothetical protein